MMKMKQQRMKGGNRRKPRAKRARGGQRAEKREPRMNLESPPAKAKHLRKNIEPSRIKGVSAQKNKSTAHNTKDPSTQKE